MNTFKVKKMIIALLFSAGIITAVFTEDSAGKSSKEFQWHTVPTLNFRMLKLEEDNTLFRPSGSLQIMRMKNAEFLSSQPELISLRLSYGQDIFSKEIAAQDVKNFHHLGVTGKVHSGRNFYILNADLNAADPFASFKNLDGVLMYGRNLVENENMSLMIGGGLAATDIGLEIGGVDICVVPWPMVRFTYRNDYFDSIFEWIGLPFAEFTLMPGRMFRLHSTCAMAGFNLPTDISFDCALRYYPVTKGLFKENLYVSAGFSTNIDKFRIATKKSFKDHYYCVYGEVSATALSLRAGYSFGGDQYLFENYEKVQKDLKTGFFFSVFGMYMF